VLDEVFPGFEVSAGQTVQYSIVDSKSRTVKNRVLAAELLEPKTRYDAQKYFDILISAGETLLKVFGYTKDEVRREVLFHQKQVMLD
jgi:DNA polymerase elongation subunit (family B)